MAAKSIKLSDPDRADWRMIHYILRIHFKKKDSTKEQYEKISRLFERAEGSWERLFTGSMDDFDLLKKSIKVVVKKPKRKKQ